MEGNMAVHEPGARVVSFEGDNCEPHTLRGGLGIIRIPREDDNVAAWRVVGVGAKAYWGERAMFLLNNRKVVAVEVHLEGVSTKTSMGVL
jgi:hypothetical protein